MHTVTTDAALAALPEEEIRAALDRYDAHCENESANESEEEEEEEEEEEDDPATQDPIVREVTRLVNAYAHRFDHACREHGHIPEEALLYQPGSPIERAAFHIFTQALHDSLQEADDE